MAINQLTFQQMQKLRPRVGEGRKLFTGVIHAHHVGLETLLRAAGVIEQMVGMTFLGPAANHLHPLISLD
ncbi:hypothetical protein D3C85_1771760 [compost metagenome]